METNYDIIQEPKIYFNQEIKKKLDESPSNKTSRVGKEKFSEKDQVLPKKNRLQKRKSSIFHPFSGKKEDKIEVNLTPNEKFLLNLENIRKRAQYLTTYSSEEMGIGAIDILISLAENKKGTFNADIIEIGEDLKRNYFSYSADARNDKLKSIIACWSPNKV